jgi:hypothetical protein
MKRVVAGTITLQQATAFWNDSEQNAMRKLDTFEREDAALRNEDARCVRPANDACRTPARQWADVLATARPAAKTWMHHMHDMQALMAGEITPDQATAAWVNNWRDGRHQIMAYDRQMKQAQGLIC